jgi:hypothetical protein
MNSIRSEKRGREINCHNTAQLRNIPLEERSNEVGYQKTKPEIPIPIAIFRILNFRSPVIGGAFG